MDSPYHSHHHPAAPNPTAPALALSKMGSPRPESSTSGSTKPRRLLEASPQAPAPTRASRRNCRPSQRRLESIQTGLELNYLLDGPQTPTGYEGGVGKRHASTSSGGSDSDSTSGSGSGSAGAKSSARASNRAKASTRANSSFSPAQGPLMSPTSQVSNRNWDFVRKRAHSADTSSCFFDYPPSDEQDAPTATGVSSQLALPPPVLTPRSLFGPPASSSAEPGSARAAAGGSVGSDTRAVARAGTATLSGPLEPGDQPLLKEFMNGSRALAQPLLDQISALMSEAAKVPNLLSQISTLSKEAVQVPRLQLQVDRLESRCAQLQTDKVMAGWAAKRLRARYELLEREAEYLRQSGTSAFCTVDLKMLEKAQSDMAEADGLRNKRLKLEREGSGGRPPAAGGSDAAASASGEGRGLAVVRAGVWTRATAASMQPLGMAKWRPERSERKRDTERAQT